MSHRALPRSFRMMQGFGVHTFRLVHARGKSTFVKFIWKPKLGVQSVLWNEARRPRVDECPRVVAGTLPDLGVARRRDCHAVRRCEPN